jgi:hypothetical protein
MSLEYYLFCRQKYEEIISNLDNILEAHDSINDCTNNEKQIESIPYKLLQHNDNKVFLFDIKTHMMKLRNLCTNNINHLCKHDFERDTIDISPDKSQNITYCKICGYTKM